MGPAGARRSQPPNGGRCKGERPRARLRSAFVEAPQVAGPRQMAELPQRLRLDLADALPRHVEAHADLFEGVVRALPDAEAQPEHLLLPRGEGGQDAAGLVAEVD